MTTQQDTAIINIITTLRAARAIHLDCEVTWINSDKSAEVTFSSGRTKYSVTVGPRGAFYSSDGRVKSLADKILSAVYRDWDAA